MPLRRPQHAIATTQMAVSAAMTATPGDIACAPVRACKAVQRVLTQMCCFLLGSSVHASVREKSLASLSMRESMRRLLLL